MKVFEVPYTYPPDISGGTEVHVAALSAELAKLGAEPVIVAPGEQEAAYTHEGLRVLRFAAPGRPANLAELYGEGDVPAVERFMAHLDRERPDLVHLHSVTAAVSLRTARAVRARKIPVVLSYSTPTVTCQRGTLLRWGTQVCDGILYEGRCSACVMHGLGVPRGAAELLARVPAAVGRGLGKAGLQGGAWTALRMRELVSSHMEATRALLNEADRLVVMAEWTAEMLVRNRIPREKITLIRYALPEESQAADAAANAAAKPKNHPFRMACLGRADPAKGMDVLIRALGADPKMPLELDFYVVAQGAGGEECLRRLRDSAAQDARIRFRPPLPRAEVTRTLSAYDLVAVPSVCLETGPFVVLEAFAAGVPVAGSRLGGIAELVTDGADGLLVEPGSVKGWADALSLFCRDEGLRARLRQGIRPPPRIGMAARQTLELYRNLAR